MGNEEQELREIKKEIIESRGLIIKTNNLVNSLGADLKTIAKKQTTYENHVKWNSAATYIIIAVLSFLGLKLAFDQFESRLESEKNEAVTKLKRLQKNFDELNAKIEKNTKIEEDALNLYALIKEAPKETVIEQLNKINIKELPILEQQFFSEQINNIKSQISMENYYSALEHINKNEWSQAYENLEKSIQIHPENNYVMEMKLNLCIVLMHLGRNNEAIVKLREMLGEELSKSLADDVYWYLAQAQLSANQIDEAKTTLRRLIKQFPRNQWERAAKTKLMELRF